MKKMIFLAGVVFVLFSCNSGNKKSSEATSDSKTEKASNKTNGKSYDCLKKYEKDYKGLLTKEEMASVYPIDFDVATKSLSSGSYGEYTYSWPSDRPPLNIEVAGMKMKTSDDNRIGVTTFSFSSGKIDKYAINTFDMGYKKLSKEELELIQNNLDKEKDEVKKTGKDLMKVRAKSSWDFVDDLGWSSWYKWDKRYGGKLAVLAGRAKFYIVIKISNDPDENRDLAKKLAEKVLVKCK